MIKYKCEICKATFASKDHDVMDLAFHIHKHLDKVIMPHEAIRYYEMIDSLD